MIYVHVGYCALKVGRYWVGVSAGNKFAKHRRRTAERALRDVRCAPCPHCDNGVIEIEYEEEIEVLDGPHRMLSSGEQ